MTTKLCLSNNYRYAYTDFHPSGIHCVFKSGPAWPESERDTQYKTIRAVRPVYGHPIQGNWLSIGRHICERLNSLDVDWTSINPLAYANEDEAKPFCPLVVSIGVEPGSLSYEAAVSAADAIKEILTLAGFATIEVAFAESAVTLQDDVKAYRPELKTSHEFMSDDEYGHHKPFTTALGLSISPLQNPQSEGTGTLNTMRLDENRQLHEGEQIIALGDTAYNHALGAVTLRIKSFQGKEQYYSDILHKLGGPTEGEDSKIRDKREWLSSIVKRSREGITSMEGLQDKVTTNRATREQRTIGTVLHSGRSSEPYSFTSDWALVELENDKIDWSTFYGNKMYIGTILGSFTMRGDGYRYPQDGLLQASGIVSDDEIRNPNETDSGGEQCLLVAKNGSTTGVTVGRVNGLESFRRDPRTKQVSIAMAVLPDLYQYDQGRHYVDRRFSAPGDDGAVVLTRDGRIVGMLAGGAGLQRSGYMGVSYLTPYWWLEKQVKAKYPDCYLHEVVESQMWPVL